MNTEAIKSISINDFNYLLPDEKIARFPLPQRDASKLLVYNKGSLQQDTYNNIASHLPTQSLLVFNNTKVIEARLLFQKSSGSVIEIFCLEPDSQYPDITTAMLQQKKVYWKCLVGGASKWKPGMILQKKIFYDSQEVELKASMHQKLQDGFIILFEWNIDTISFAEILHLFGNIPIPPYLKRLSEESDKERYQTIYAAHDGSVAAPTAGLHFTENIFNSLQQKKIDTAYVTLHVGAGTFKPVSSDTIEQHDMHVEYIDVNVTTLQQLIQNAGNIFAVGTTSLRTLETLYWLGVKTIINPSIHKNEMTIKQWEVYEILKDTEADVNTALTSLLQWMKKQELQQLITTTQILIAPGYHIKMIKGLITNFHQPQSTLLLLIAALIGNDWKKSYDYALENDFRFLSYGDGNLIIL